MDTLDRILNLIKEKGVSDLEFTRAIGATDRNLVRYWEKKATKSYMKYIPQIARYFNVSTDYLHGLKDERN